MVSTELQVNVQNDNPEQMSILSNIELKRERGPSAQHDDVMVLQNFGDGVQRFPGYANSNVPIARFSTKMRVDKGPANPNYSNPLKLPNNPSNAQKQARVDAINCETITHDFITSRGCHGTFDNPNGPSPPLVRSLYAPYSGGHYTVVGTSMNNIIPWWFAKLHNGAVPLHLLDDAGQHALSSNDVGTYLMQQKFPGADNMMQSIGGALSYGRHHNGDGGFEIKDSPDLMDPDAKPIQLEQDDKKELKCYPDATHQNTEIAKTRSNLSNIVSAKQDGIFVEQGDVRERHGYNTFSKGDAHLPTPDWFSKEFSRKVQAGSNVQEGYANAASNHRANFNTGGGHDFRENELTTLLPLTKTYDHSATVMDPELVLSQTGKHVNMGYFESTVEKLKQYKQAVNINSNVGKGSLAPIVPDAQRGPYHDHAGKLYARAGLLRNNTAVDVGYFNIEEDNKTESLRGRLRADFNNPMGCVRGPQGDVTQKLQKFNFARELSVDAGDIHYENWYEELYNCHS